MSLVGRLYHFLSHHVGHCRNTTRTIFSLSVIDQSFSISCVYVWKVIIDTYLTKPGQFSSNDFYFGVISLVVLWQSLSFASRFAKNRQIYKTKVLADKISMQFFESAYSHIINLSHDFHESRSTGQLVRQLSKAREDLDKIIHGFFDKLVLQAISFTIVTGFFFYIQWQIALVMLSFLPIFFFVTRHYSKNIDLIQKEINSTSEKSYNSVQQALDAFMVVQSFQSQRTEKIRLKMNNRLAHHGTQRKTHAFQKLAFVQAALVNIARLCIIALGGYFVFQGSMTVGEVILLSMWGFYVYNPMFQFSDLLALFAEGMDSVERVEKLLKIQPAITSPKGGYNPDKVKGDVRFEQVSFAYPSAPTRGVKNIDFHQQAGRKFAVVGPSGSGKSTLAKLLPRFYDVTQGGITIDGVDIRQWDLAKLRASIGIVMQEVVLFNDTIYNNIVYACAGKGKDMRQAVEQAAKKASAHDFIMALPDGYDTIVGERGIKLSGGEKQRIGIARTILRDPPILILDEATSALDSESEVMVIKALDQICKNHTTFTIAHRLSTIRHCDQILFCEQGELVEQGCHDQLMALKGRYYTYVELQKQKETYPGEA